MICFGAWVQCFFTLIVVDYVHFASPYDKVYKCKCVGDVLFIIPGKNSSFNQGHADESGDDLYGIFTTEAPEFINLSTRYDLNAEGKGIWHEERHNDMFWCVGTMLFYLNCG